MRKISFIMWIWVICSMDISAQQSVTVPFDSSSWNTENAEFLPATYQGVEGILLMKGGLFLEDVDFLNGVVEVDINFSNRRNFPGVLFRIQDTGNFEQFYIRPHQSGNPDANQYTPVFNGTVGWQLYYGEKWAFPITYEFDKWHHIKIVVSGSKADIYFDDMDKAALKVDLLRDVASGKIGLNSGIAPIYYANFKYTLTEGPSTVEPMASEAEVTAITKWNVSNVIGDSVLMDKYQLDKAFKNNLEWNSYQSEASGLINLARYGQRSQGNSTVAVRVEVVSKIEQVKRLDFGFSDKVRVYLNDKAIYEGHDRFVSRDYRFLGTIGFFDTVFLPLKKGKNELWFVVSEAFGGVFHAKRGLLLSSGRCKELTSPGLDSTRCFPAFNNKRIFLAGKDHAVGSFMSLSTLPYVW